MIIVKVPLPIEPGEGTNILRKPKISNCENELCFLLFLSCRCFTYFRSLNGHRHQAV